MASVEDEVRRADPLSVNPGQRPGREDEEICTAGRCRCRCSAGVCQRRRSAAHLHRLLCPRRCRGLTEDVTARAVGQRLWSSGVPPARRQQGRVKSRHAALRSAYRVMSECRRSATISADVCGDDVVARPLARSDSALLREAVMGVARPLRYDACLSGGEGRVDQKNVVGGTSERRV